MDSVDAKVELLFQIANPSGILRIVNGATPAPCITRKAATAMRGLLESVSPLLESPRFRLR